MFCLYQKKFKDAIKVKLKLNASGWGGGGGRLDRVKLILTEYFISKY